MRTHRWGRRVAIALAVTVAFLCMTDTVAPTEP